MSAWFPWILLILVSCWCLATGQEKVCEKDKCDQEQLVGESGGILDEPCPTGQLVSDCLWNNTVKQREEALHSPFTQGVAYGRLDPTVFGGYMVQDSVYCYLVQQSIEVAAQRTDNETLKAFLIDEAASYKEYAAALFKSWNIDDYKGIYLHKACASYAAFMNTTAYTEDAIYFIVAMLPCSKLWPWLGQEIADEGDHGVYTKWVNENLTGSGYKQKEALINTYPGINETTSLNIFTQGMQHEADFFWSATLDNYH